MSAKETAVRAMRGDLANIEDNLHRYRHFGRPDDRTGNGETFAAVIERLERKRDDLLAAIAELS